MIRTLEVLYAHGVLDEDAKLTSPIGFQVSEIPLLSTGICKKKYGLNQLTVTNSNSIR
ncbi:hypothetical protein Scep_009264 [Stephania cephalantha]|uniref:Uncharacterized protein n=1 Tax=Stephania cephalantha TaxID=152367 RepID=A0AAP0PCD7_9MAGN